MKRIEIICDLCNQPILEQDARITEYLEDNYLCTGSDICQNCYLKLDLAGVLIKKSIINKESPQDYLKRWASSYGLIQDDVK